MMSTNDVTMTERPSTYPDAVPIERELEEKFPHRPHNHSQTLPFHDLYLHLFNPLNENKKPTGSAIARKKQGPHGPAKQNPHEVRRGVIERFISRWRKEVGNDIFPAFRLIIPDKDRDRAMYGLKEKTIGRILVKIMGITRNSEDGSRLLNWKLPGQGAASRMAGDFAGRCYEALEKRALLSKPGKMTIGEVNDLLDELAAAQKESTQINIFQRFYSSMNKDELMWLIRILLRQMKVGATERTFFSIWHPDAEKLYNISSSLRRVCWDLPDPSVRLESDDTEIGLMQCFQPQLAQFQTQSMQKIVDKMRLTEDDPVFWIEEKLDGERMQLHMVSDDDVPGGKTFGFWSRKAKDYTYLYGNSFYDQNSALTRHIKEAFSDNVHDIILDGEMITWDPELDKIVPFGTLKTAALAEQRNPFQSTGQRPLYRVFDILYLNGRVLTDYTLRDRRRALEASLNSINRRIEMHGYVEARSIEDIETNLRKIIADGSEGLVLKSPRSSYHLNQRHDDWMKVKPEYLTEYGESLDCVVIGGYYGSGRRGGSLSSFLCGLRVDENEIRKGDKPMKCWSFFKVGGGFNAADYAAIRHKTDGKWIDWDVKRPPKDYIELGGGDAQYERPDVWIKPEDSVVLSVKGASCNATDQFRIGLTLRFPRFKQLRNDRDWQSALSVQEFKELKKDLDRKLDENFQLDEGRGKRVKTSRKKPITIAGSDLTFKVPYNGPQTIVFEGLSFYVLTDSVKPQKKTKTELEELIKENGGKIYQMHNASVKTICIAERRVVKVASLEKAGKVDVVKPAWLFDCIAQSEVDAGRPGFLLPWEPRHMLCTTEDSKEDVDGAVDEYGDSYTRDTTIEELKDVFDQMPNKFEHLFSSNQFRDELEQHSCALSALPGQMFENCIIYPDQASLMGTADHHQQDVRMSSDLMVRQACITARFGGARVVHDLKPEGATHVLVGDNRSRIQGLRERLSTWRRLPRLVTVDWIEQSWEGKTLLDEERFAPV